MIHWEDEDRPASPDGIFQSLPEIVRPRSISVDSFRLREEIDHWPNSISLSSATFDYPTGVQSSSLLDGESPDQGLGLTRVNRPTDEQWRLWLERRILQARLSHELVESDDTLDVLIWGDTRLGLLPLMKEGEEWFLRQKLMTDGSYVPILDVIVALAGPEARLTDLLITIHSSVYSPEEQFLRSMGVGFEYSWIARFLNQSVDRFHHWFRRMILGYAGNKLCWHANGPPWMGSRIHQVFTELLGPEEAIWDADVG